MYSDINKKEQDKWTFAPFFSDGSRPDFFIWLFICESNFSIFFFQFFFCPRMETKSPIEKKRKDRQDYICFWHPSQAYAATVYDCFSLTVFNGADQSQVARYDEIYIGTLARPIEFWSTFLILGFLFSMKKKSTP